MVNDPAHLKNQSMLDIEQNLSTVSVVLDKNMQRIGTIDPSQQTRVRRERNDGILDNGKMSLEGFGILLQQSIDEAKELHDTLVLSKILVSCERWMRQSVSA